MQTRLQGGKNVLILKIVQNSFRDVKTEKTSLSAWINIWINPGFLMQSGALAIPSTESTGLLDELSKPQELKEINWNPPPPTPSSIFSFCPFKNYPTAWDGGTLMCEIDSSWECWSLAVSFWDLRLNPPPDSRRREGKDKAFSLETEGEGRGKGRGWWVHWQLLRIWGDLGDDFISNGQLSSNSPSSLRKNTLSYAVSSSLLMCFWN